VKHRPNSRGNREKPAFERWMWVELVAFDSDKEDFGVNDFLARAGFAPDALSLLMFNPDFVHTHDGAESDRALPADFGAYWGRRQVGSSQSQTWTPRRIKGLARQLRTGGVAVYFSVFDVFDSREWIGRHPEIMHMTRDGERLASICPWKRLASGQWYEDFFIAKLLEVARDYNFDGYHCADGYAHQRISIYDGDFSDDMVAQFAEGSGVALPRDVAGPCDGEASLVRGRADWIWRSKRSEWIEFYVRRVETFFRKLGTALHKAGKSVAANTAWTKDPFEAAYRYGVDYRRIAEWVDVFIVEAAAAAADLDGYEATSGRRALQPFSAATLLIKACAPAARLIFLNGIKDITERWDALRHSAPALEREIYALSNLFLRNKRGKLGRCASGLMACLADGIEPSEWRTLDSWWRLAFRAGPNRVLGAELVWSDTALERQLNDFIETRRWTTHRLLHHLLARGAPVISAVNAKHIEQARGALLVLRPELFGEEELRRLRDYRNGPVIFIGAKTEPVPSDALLFEDVYEPEATACYALGDVAKADVKLGERLARAPVPDMTAIPEPSGPHAMFYYDLYFREVSDAFLDACAEVVRANAGGPQVLSELEYARALAVEDDKGELLIFASSDSNWYVTPRIDVGRPIRRIEVLTRFPGMPVEPEGSEFRVRIPPRGVAVLRVRTD